MPLNIITSFQETAVNLFNNDIFSETDFNPATRSDREQDDGDAENGAGVNPTPEDSRPPDKTPVADSSRDVVQRQRQQADGVQPSTFGNPDSPNP